MGCFAHGAALLHYLLGGGFDMAGNREVVRQPGAVARPVVAKPTPKIIAADHVVEEILKAAGLEALD